jgi:hypothetical protein
MPTDESLDEQLRSQLAELGDDEMVDVLVHPASSAGELETHLSDLRSAGDVQFNPLPLHGSIAVRAPVRLIRSLAARDDVARITSMPTAGIA